VFKGIGPKLERAIWAAGVTDWDSFLREGTGDEGGGDRDQPSGGVARAVGRSRHRRLVAQVEEWAGALERHDTCFFAKHLPPSEHWHLFEELGGAVRYLDIETTGLSPWRDVVTVVGIHDGAEFHGLVRGKNLSAGSIREHLEGCKLLVSFYGSAFDVPFLATAFPELSWDIPHFDLCFAARKVGLTGGLKRIEKVLGIRRHPSLVEVDGFEAVRLWRRYRRGDEPALQKLVAYNEADTANLAIMAPMVYRRLCDEVSKETGVTR
jgi:hypothetical protein